MHIVVIGAGEVGSYVALRLSKEGHDVALVERSASRIAELEASLDALVVHGSGTNPDTLTHARTDRADLFVAVTSDDETNIVSSMLAKHQGAPRTVVRIESPHLRQALAGGLAATVGADVLIDPDEETAAEILELVQYPGAIEVESMADGRILVLGVRLEPTAPVVGQTLQELGRSFAPEWPFLFAAITRGDRTVIPRGDHRLDAGDLVRIVCTPEHRSALNDLLGLSHRRLQRVVLLGGGRTAELVARRLSKRVRDVVVAERDEDRAQHLALNLHDAEVLQGDVTDVEFLDAIGLGPQDLVVALTGDDDANVLASLYARAAGVQETIAVAHRLSLLRLLRHAGVDGAISPRTATANAVLRFARGPVTAVATSLRDDVEVLEIEVAPDSAAAGRAIADLHLPKEALVGAVLSGNRADIGRGNTVLRPNDTVVVIAKPSAVSATARAFT